MPRILIVDDSRMDRQLAHRILQKHNWAEVAADDPLDISYAEDGVGALEAAHAAPPDLILTEIASTDAIQHASGYASPEADWSIAHADMLVGRLVSALDRAGRRADYAIAVASDHGHAPIELYGEEGSLFVPDPNFFGGVVA